MYRPLLILQVFHVLFRCAISELTVWTERVVVDPSCLNGLLGVVQIEKPVFVQAIITKAAVEACDERILHRPTGLNERQRHAVPMRPLIAGFTPKLRPVVAHDALRIAAPAGETV